MSARRTLQTPVEDMYLTNEKSSQRGEHAPRSLLTLLPPPPHIALNGSLVSLKRFLKPDSCSVESLPGPLVLRFTDGQISSDVEKMEVEFKYLPSLHSALKS